MKDARPHNDEDDDLRQRFAELRERDTAELPAFEQPRVATPQPVIARAWPRTAGWGLASAVMLAALWLAWPRLRPADPEPPQPLQPLRPGWRLPTDSLLSRVNDLHRANPWASLPTTALGQRPSLTNQELQ